MGTSTSGNKMRVQSVEILDIDKQARFFEGQTEPLACRVQIWIAPENESFEEVFDSTMCNEAYLLDSEFAGPTVLSQIIVHNSGDLGTLTDFLREMVDRMPTMSIDEFRLAFSRVGRSDQSFS